MKFVDSMPDQKLEENQENVEFEFRNRVHAVKKWPFEIFELSSVWEWVFTTHNGKFIISPYVPYFETF